MTLSVTLSKNVTIIVTEEEGTGKHVPGLIACAAGSQEEGEPQDTSSWLP